MIDKIITFFLIYKISFSKILYILLVLLYGQYNVKLLLKYYNWLVEMNGRWNLMIHDGLEAQDAVVDVVLSHVQKLLSSKSVAYVPTFAKYNYNFLIHLQL